MSNLICLKSTNRQMRKQLQFKMQNESEDFVWWPLYWVVLCFHTLEYTNIYLKHPNHIEGKISMPELIPPFLEVKFSNWKIKLDKLWTFFFILMSDVNKTKWNNFERLVELVFFRQYFLDQMILSDWSKLITLFYCVRDWFDWFQNYILSKCTQKFWMLKTIYNKTNERINKETHISHFYWLYKIDNKFRS